MVMPWYWPWNGKEFIIWREVGHRHSGRTPYLWLSFSIDGYRCRTCHHEEDAWPSYTSRYVRRGTICLHVKFASLCLRQVSADDYLRENEVGCIFGNDSSAQPVIEAAKIMDEKHDSANVGLWTHLPVDELNGQYEPQYHLPLRGVNFTVSSACASGSHL